MDKKTDTANNTIICIGTFDGKNKQLLDILHRHWRILTADPDLTDVVTSYPSVTYRRGKNIRDKVVHSHYKPPSPPKTWLQSRVTGSYPCGGCFFFVPISPQKEEFYQLS